MSDTKVHANSSKQQIIDEIVRKDGGKFIELHLVTGTVSTILTVIVYMYLASSGLYAQIATASLFALSVMSLLPLLIPMVMMKLLKCEYKMALLTSGASLSLPWFIYRKFSAKTVQKVIRSEDNISK